jgi:hypothetical protein
VGNIDYDTLGVSQMDLLQLVRMPTLIALYWTKKVHAMRLDKIRFSKDVDEHRPCEITDVKVILLFLLVSCELLNFEDEISIRRGECSDPNI